MFKIYVDDVLMYDDVSTLESLKLVDPKLTIPESSAGTFTATVPPGNAGYDHLERTKSLIKIFKGTDEDPYWEGRILEEVVDFWNCKKITCEGILSYLNDTIQPPNYYSNTSAREFLGALLEVHNSKVSADKQFLLGDTGDITLNSSHRYTNYETTMQCINEKLIENNGGYIRIRYDDGKRYLDYLKEYASENTQKIEFGLNLMDFAKSFNSENYCTVLVPRGAQLEEGPYEALTAYTDVSTVNDGSIYVTLKNEDFPTPPTILPVNYFGWIEAVHDWDDVTEPGNLLRKAKAYLKDLQFDNMKLEVSALDMHYAGATYDEIKLGDSVRVLSTPHGMDRAFPVTKLEIPLDKPEETVFTMGTNEKVSLTHRNRQANNAIKKQISELPTEQKLTAKLKDEAAQMIESATTGYINIIQNENGAEELVISSTPDYTTAPNIWRFNLNGLAFSSHGYDSGNYDIALTADGKINASLISVGTLVADIIKAGVLKDQIDGSHFYFNLDTGEFHLKALDGMRIGGRNIIRGTGEVKRGVGRWSTADFKVIGAGSWGSTVFIEDVENSPIPQIRKAFKFKSTANNQTLSIAQEAYKMIGRVGEQTVFSAWVKGNVGDRIRLLHWTTNTASEAETFAEWFTLESSDWTRLVSVSDPIKYDHNSIPIGYISVVTAAVGNEVYALGLKEEFGTVATEWTPAPEDQSSNIGGRNILRGTGDMTLTTTGTWSDGTYKPIWTTQVTDGAQEVEEIFDSPVPGITKALKFTKFNGDRVTLGAFQPGYPMKGHVGEYLTISCYVKGHAGDKVYFNFNNSGSSSDPDYETENSPSLTLWDDQWTKVCFTSTKPIMFDHAATRIGFVYVTIANEGDSFYIIGLKEEFGVIGTSWTPAPEDVTDDIDQLNLAIREGDNNTYDLLSTLLSTEINNTAEKFEIINTRIDTFENGLEERIATEVESKAGELAIRIEEQRETLEGIEDNLTYFGFKNTGLEIRGTKGSSAGSYLNLASDELALYSNNTKHLWLNQNGANAAYFNAEQGVAIGAFIWEIYSGGIRLRKR